MDLNRIRHLAGIINEAKDVTKAVETGTLKTDDSTEAITNQLVQGEKGDIRVSDEAKPEAKKNVPADVKQKKALGLKEAFATVMKDHKPKIKDSAK